MRKRTTEVDGQVGASSDGGTGARAAKRAKRAEKSGLAGESGTSGGSSKRGKAGQSVKPGKPGNSGKRSEQGSRQDEPHGKDEHGKQRAKEAKQETKQAAQRVKEAKQETKQAAQRAKQVQSGEHGKLTPGNAKKIVGIVTAVGPAIAPFAGRAAVLAREGYDRMRAHRLGVAVDDLGRFSGKGAGLHARISGDANALADLRARTAGRTDEENRAAERFADTAEHRLGELASAVRATERMPPARRRAAHHAVEGELDRIEDDLLRRFGIGA